MPSYPSYFALLLITPLVAACVSIDADKKSRSHPDVYDFVLLSGMATRVPTQIAISNISAAESLNNNRIRYRLAYKDSSQVYTYTESRWISPPAELLSHSLRSLTSGPTPATAGNSDNCSLKLQLEAFDQVFDTAQHSSGIVQINVSLIENRTRKLLTSQPIEEKAEAASADARGGVAALNKAAIAALSRAVNWANATSVQFSACQNDISQAPDKR